MPFRSVARHLIRGLGGADRDRFQLEVLRPPIFAELARCLRAARAKGEPFHALHFDGHGLSGEIFFESPELKGNAQPVKAAELGRLLHETGVPLLILNACRSATSEPPQQPQPAADLHQQIRQFGSFAHAVMDCGASGVVAWRIASSSIPQRNIWRTSTPRWPQACRSARVVRALSAHGALRGLVSFGGGDNP